MTSDALFSPLLERAMQVAARMHRGQTRKQSDLPYISHPAAVAMILMKAGFTDDHLLAAALLHDVIEDTNCTAAELSAEFPEHVVGTVSALSERKRDESGAKRSWEDRKREHIEQLRGASFDARAIALADKLHNLGTIQCDLERDGPMVWERFNAPRDRLFWYYRTVVAAVNHGESELKLLADACREMIDRLECG